VYSEESRIKGGAGIGLFTRNAVLANTTIGSVGGTVLCHECYYDKYVKGGSACSYVLCVDPKEQLEFMYYIDASDSTCFMRYINHQRVDKCNLRFVSAGICQGGSVRIDVVTSRDIDAREELFGNYMSKWKKQRKG